MSASRLWLWELCALSANLKPMADITPRHARDLGTAIHRFLEHAARDGRDAALMAVQPQYAAMCAAIDFDSMPHAQNTQWAFEVAYAYDPETDAGRELHRGGGRDYSMLAPGEVPGTLDLIGVAGNAVVVLDVKTGKAALEEAEDALQLLFGAIAACRALGKDEAIVGWLRLVDGQPRYQWAKLDAFKLDVEVRSRLQRILEEVRSANPRPTLGPHCARCNALTVCPAQATLAREVTRAALATESAPLAVPIEQMPDFYRWVGAIGALYEKLSDYLNLRAREMPIPIGNGKVFGPVETTREYVDPLVAETVLKEIDPALAEKATTRTIEITKTSIGAAVRALPLPAGVKITHRERSIVDAIRAAGGISPKTTKSLKEHKPEPAAALPEATKETQT